MPGASTWQLALARSAAWALLMSGWVGLGGVAMAFAARPMGAYVLVAFWLLSLGLAATVATRDELRAGTRRVALLGCGALAAAALWVAASSAGQASLAWLAVGAWAWACMTALASGVVRSLRRSQAARPQPPVAEAALGAAWAALALADPTDGRALAWRLALLVSILAVGLAVLQPRDLAPPRGGRCRAGLFDCSLPAWPAGAWKDTTQWPTLIAGLAMLPLMAALPAMLAWCRASSLSPALMLSLHLGAMFVPALIWHGTVSGWGTARLATVCALLLVAGGVSSIVLPDAVGGWAAAVLQGAAWSLAWAGQLWAPERRSQQGASPWRAALGYALLTLGVGVLVDARGPAGLGDAQIALGLLAALAWLADLGRHRPRNGDDAPEHRHLPR